MQESNENAQDFVRGDYGDASPLISIIIPVYNVEDWIEECLRSVCAQTYRNLEILVVNDGSLDKSREICASFAGKDSRICLLDRKNGGLSAARNTGIANAHGEYIAFVDSDDVVHQRHIELLYGALSKLGADIAVTQMTRFEERYSVCTPKVGVLMELTSDEAIKTMFYQGVFDSCAQAKLYKREAWDDVRFPEGYLHEDLPTAYQVFIKAYKIAFFESDTYGYRVNLGGINFSPSNDRKIETLALLDGVVTALTKLEKIELAKAAKCLRSSFALHLFLNIRDDSVSEAGKLILKNYIKKDRFEVVLDCHARKKTRAALVLSMGSERLLAAVYKYLGRR